VAKRMETEFRTFKNIKCLPWPSVIENVFFFFNKKKSCEEDPYTKVVICSMFTV